MLQRVIPLLVAGALASSLAACGGDDDNNDSSWSSSSSSVSSSSSSESSSSEASSSSSSSLPSAAVSPCEKDGATDGTTWCALAFGQSVDVNFSSTILPEKIGTNYVWRNGSTTPMAVTEAGVVSDTVTIESRGGKIANTHDGLTYYYTRLPTDKNFVLEGDVTVEQFGPEILVDGVQASTNGQESAGLMVRDVIGTPRQDPLVEGYEEFPSASNVVANAIMQNGKNNAGKVMLQTLYRDGVNYRWGNTGAIIPKANFIAGSYGLQAPTTFKMSLQRTNEGFVVGYADANGANAQTMTVAGANANIMQTIDDKNMYVGFYASRNARITVKNIKLTLSSAQTVNAPKYVAPAETVRFELASPAKTVANAYTLQARGNYDGTVTVTQDGTALTTAALKAGEVLAIPTTISGASSTFELVFTGANGVGNKTVSTTVSKVVVADASSIYVSPTGAAANTGTQASPLNLATALQVVAPGGTIRLLSGSYSATTMSVDMSGSKDARKSLVAETEGMAIFTGAFTMNASYWHIKGIEVAGAQFRMSGSHNIIERVVTHHNVDTGFQISASGVGKALWPSHNLVLNSTSYSNKDASAINADGFAAKLGVGDGNVFRGCLSYGNADDGWDLFNKIEDGANGTVTIEDSVAYDNGNNGFKLGGEGQPVAHTIRDSFAFHNNLDGFTDNFNPGAIVVTNNFSYDNVRFNYIFRPSPYGGPETQSHFTGNRSLRSDYAGKYDDAVVGVDDGTNSFIKDGQPISVSTVKAAAAKPLVRPTHASRNADGSLNVQALMQGR
ncbi:MAG: right-handed parallel beta-helix repeat-containing protein [Rhodocyclaceae bacterium]